MQLSKIIELNGTIEVLTGLHIGGGNSEMHIGGSDNPVVRHPHTREPYLPGSSLKGKIRSLLEWRAGLADVNGGEPMSCAKLEGLGRAGQRADAEAILKLFGISGGEDPKSQEAMALGPTRLSFRDCALTRAWVEDVRQKKLPLTEIKMENTIDRVRGVAVHPRNSERVPAGAKFEFSLCLRHLQEGDDKLLDTLFIGMKLLEMDSLGGSGSRGYGRVKFALGNPEHQKKLDDAKPW
ncbi:MAG: type III-A CRISPR-associated RAMP protein Csm3 [Magnetococcus sp. WYHC-3]